MAEQLYAKNDNDDDDDDDDDALVISEYSFYYIKS